MLESLGYSGGGRARRGGADPVQHLLDPRGGRQPLHRAPRRGQAAQARTARARGRRGRLLGAVGQGGGLRALPVRRRGLRPRPGAPAGRVPDQRLADAPRATSSSRASRAICPARRARAFQGWVQISVGCNCACSYCIVPSTRGREVSRPLAGAGRGGRRDGRRRRPRGDAARAERQLLRARPARPTSAAGKPSFAGLLRAARWIEGIERIRYTSPHPKDMREDVIRAHAELRERVRAHPPAAAVGLQPDPQGDAPHLRPRALPRPRRDDPRAPARRRPQHRHHRRLPRRDRGGLRRRRSRWSSRSATTAPSRSSSRRGAAPRRRELTEGIVPHPVKVERMERLVELVQRQARASAPSASSGARVEVLVEGPSRTDPERLRGRTSHNKVVNFAGLAAPGELTEVRDLRGHQPDADGRGAPARPGRLKLRSAAALAGNRIAR